MKRHLITSAIPYINGVKHLGNLVGSQLPADLFARYQRAKGNEVLFLCATDEHGTPAELAAEKAGKPIAEYCDEMHTIQSKLAKGFRLSFDHFGRSSSQQNHKLTQHFAAKLSERGLVKEITEKQVFSNQDQRFLPDRYIEGTCPNCGFEEARGDQCDNCTKQLQPNELINPRSTISGSTDLEERETKHLHLRQSLMKEELESWIDSKSDWPILTTSIAKKWLNDGDGLQDRGITRDLNWGIPVKKGKADWPGMDGKVFYVWFDAPIEYIACAEEWVDAGKGKDWYRWWKTNKGADDVIYTQFMGKDNVPFHTLSFPATILGSGEPWKLVDYIKSFNYLNYDGGQFSTSRNRGIFMDQALEILPPDYWRWWLLSHAPESSDSEFTWENFQQTVNKDLADVLGNFVSRVTKFCRSKFGQVIPTGGVWSQNEINLVNEIEKRVTDYEGHMESKEIRKSANELRAIWACGNEYLQSAEPWSTFKSDPEASAMQIRLSFNLIKLYGVLSAPFIPDAAEKIFKALNLSNENWPNNISEALDSIPKNAAFEVPEVMFTKITDEQRESWKEQFSGN